MRDACGEQADGGEFFGLGELGFKLDAVGDVVDEDDAANGSEVSVTSGAMAMLAMRVSPVGQ